MRFAQADEVGAIFGSFGGPARCVAKGPEFPLNKVFQTGYRHSDTKHPPQDCASGKRGVAGIDSDLKAEPASGELGIDRMREFLHLKTAGFQSVRQTGRGCDGKVRVQGDDGFDVVVHRQPADEAEGLTGGL